MFTRVCLSLALLLADARMVPGAIRGGRRRPNGNTTPGER